MKLTKQQYAEFKLHVQSGLQKVKKTQEHIKAWLTSIGDEKLSHYNCLTAVRLAMRSDEGWAFVQSVNLKDNHWATIGKKYFKELAA